MGRRQNFKCNCGKDTCKWSCFLLWCFISVIFILSAEFTQDKHCSEESERTNIIAFPIGAAFAFLLIGPFLCTLCGSAKVCKTIFLLVFIGTAATCTVFAVLSILKSCDNEALLIALFATGWLSAFIGGCVFGRILSNVVGYIRA